MIGTANLRTGPATEARIRWWGAWWLLMRGYPDRLCLRSRRAPT
jgi:hypothetical protein